MLAAMGGYMVDCVHMNWATKDRKEAERLKEKVKKVLEERGFRVLEAEVDHAIRGYWTPFFSVVVMTVDEWNEMYPKGYEVAEKIHRKLKKVLEDSISAEPTLCT